MNIKNYTSEVPASRSMAQIEEYLVEVGASNINKQYEDKVCTGITFLLYDKQIGQTLAFHLKAQVQECFSILWREVKRPQPDSKERYMKQAESTAWKILADWTAVQCTMIILGQAAPLQMFLPFAYDAKSQETLYDKIASGKTKMLPGL
jgi:hypothetical protein